jgi:hypothetical protein
MYPRRAHARSQKDATARFGRRSPARCRGFRMARTLLKNAATVLATIVMRPPLRHSLGGAVRAFVCTPIEARNHEHVEYSRYGFDFVDLRRIRALDGGASSVGPGPTVTAGPGSGAGPGSSVSSASTTSSGGCQAPGDSCTDTNQCCMSGPTVGPLGAVCISNDNQCHAMCNTGSDCSSGCCAGVTGQSYGVCAPSSDCSSCSSPGQSCSVNGDCCMSGTGVGPDGAGCVNGSCAACCTASSQCTSGCCIETQPGDACGGVCGAYQAGYTCL